MNLGTPPITLEWDYDDDDEAAMLRSSLLEASSANEDDHVNLEDWGRDDAITTSNRCWDWVQAVPEELFE
jgi:hypothetical protein